MTDIQRLFLLNPSAFKAAILSSDQLDLYKEIQAFGELSSVDTARIFGISVQSASTRLKTLFKKGYLSRNKLVSESGGIEFMYYAH